jgi:hypothetical protein
MSIPGSSVERTPVLKWKGCCRCRACVLEMKRKLPRRPDQTGCKGLADRLQGPSGKAQPGFAKKNEV